MKVLLYTHEFPPFRGGLATTSYKLAKGFSESGLNALVLAPGYGAGDKRIDSSLPCTVYRIPSLGSKWIKLVPFLGTLLGLLYLTITVVREKPDAVLFITEEAETVGGLMPWFPFKPVVRVAGSGITTAFCGPKIGKKFMRYPMKRLYMRSNLIIAVSQNTKELIESIGVSSQKIRVIYNGVEDSMLSKAPDINRISHLRERLGIAGSDKVLITVARVLPRKGQDTVIKALPQVVREFPGLKYLIVGEGRYSSQFKELALESGVSKHVIFTGGVRHEDTLDYYDLADIFIMPNRYWNNKIEGLPNAIIEASARSKPVIAGDHGGSREAVEDGVTGILVDPESVDDTTEAILSLLNDGTIVRKMGEKGRERVLKYHTEGAMVESYYGAINEVLNEGQR
jgi:phosphatidyl-myo-inositol dimannoside synthase